MAGTGGHGIISCVNAWWIVMMVGVAIVVLLAPFIRHTSNKQSEGERAYDWMDTVVKTITGLWPR